MNNKLKVGVLKNSYPYSSYKDSVADGLSVKIWENVALENNLQYEYIGIEENIDNAFLNIAQNKIDILLGDINVSKKEYNNALFSIPYCKQQLNIFRKSKNNIFNILYLILTDKIIIYCLFFSITIVIFFTFLYKIFAKTTFMEALYQSNVYFITGNDVEFIKNKHIFSKIINCIYPLINFLFFTIIFSEIIKINLNLIDNISGDEINKIKDCYVVDNDHYEELLIDMNIKPIVNSLDDIIKNIVDNENTYWMDDKEIITNILNDRRISINLASLETPIINLDCVIVVNKKNSNILHLIDRTILNLRENEKMEQLCEIYFKENSKLTCYNIHNYNKLNLSSE